MDDCFRNATKKLVYHDSFVVFWNSIERFLNYMTSKRVHAEAQGISTNGISNSDDLFRSSVLEAALDKEVSESIDHQRVCLRDNGFNNFVLLFDGTNLEFLL